MGVMLLVISMVSMGCGGKKKRPAGTAGAPKKKVVTAPVATEEKKDKKTEFTYVYSPVGKRDPFRSFYKVEKIRPKGSGTITVLQQYEIQQMKLSAIISGISKPRAQVELPDGKGYTIKVGSVIGKNHGRVVRIRHDEVVVAEEYRDPAGRKVTNYLKMKIRKKAE